MADVGPDPGLAQQKARLDIVTQEQKIAHYLYELMQQKVQRDKTISNIKASERALQESKDRLDGLIEAHGELLPPNINKE